MQDKPYKSTTESPRLYHSDAAETLRGTVVSTETVTPAEGAAPFVQLNLKTGEEIVPVHLGPQWFMEEQSHRIDLDKGREVEIKGSKNIVDGRPAFIAAEIRDPKQDQRLRLRHEDGMPVRSASEHAS